MVSLDSGLSLSIDADLYLRGAETLLGSWEEYARGTKGAELRRFAGVGIAVFPNEPERSVYNNALLTRDLCASDRDQAIENMEAAYDRAGVGRFAAWVHECDAAMRSDLGRRGYTVDEVTRAMGMTLDDMHPLQPKLELGPAKWSEHLRIAGLPSDFLNAVDTAAFHVLVAALGGENVATAIAFDCGTDCGIYNVGTLQRARRRGLGTALTTLQLRDAASRGCRTASLQSTAMAVRMYAAMGFRDLGRIFEYIPSQRRHNAHYS